MKFLLLLSLCATSAFARFTTSDVPELVAQSELRDSDALIVWQYGKVLHSFNRNPEQQYSIQSVTKSLTAMAVACLGKEKPGILETKNLFPEWEGTPKADITLRMLLQMTSGIQDPMDFWTRNAWYDFSAELPLMTTPGWMFSYANASTMLVSRWVKQTTKQPISWHMNKCFFEPMGIKDWRMNTDANGDDVASGGLYMKAEDLLKIGVLLIQNGVYENKMYLYSNQVADFRLDYLKDGNGYGIGFWTWGRKIYYAEGFLGQFVMLVPREQLVVVRLRNPPGMLITPEHDLNWMHEMPWFLEKLL